MNTGFLAAKNAASTGAGETTRPWELGGKIFDEGDKGRGDGLSGTQISVTCRIISGIKMRADVTEEDLKPRTKRVRECSPQNLIEAPTR